MDQPLTLKDVIQKLRIVKPKAVGKDEFSIGSYSTTRVTALADGINLNRQDGGLVKYSDISLLVTFQLDSDPDTWYVDVFVYGQPSSFRISQKAVNYRQFLPEISQRSKDNFYMFLLHLINQADSVYVDENTLEFLKSQKMFSFPDFKLVADFSRQLWFQLISWMKFQCDQCKEVYWVDDAKVSIQGAKTKCVKCQNVITVKKRPRPEPLKPKEKRKTIPCPHCQYENPEGTQFCVMCQKPLAPLQPPPTKVPSAEETAQIQEVPPPKVAEPPADLVGLPLQAREQRRPRLSFREIAEAMLDDINTMKPKFSWFRHFSWGMQLLGFVFLFAGVFIGIYIYFMLEPKPPAGLSPKQQLIYAGISVGVGFLFWLVCLIVSNIIALTLEIERNTKVTTILLQKLISKDES